MMHRRTFLRLTNSAAAIAGFGGLLAACAPKEKSAPETKARTKFGVQIYTVRDLLQVDVRKTLMDIAAIGYKEIELFGIGANVADDKPLYGLTAKDFGAALADAGLRAPIAHIDGKATNIAEIADLMRQIGVKHLVVSIAPEFLSVDNGKIEIIGVTGRDQLDRIAERLNRQGELCKASGLGFGYHNHPMEFASLGDENAYDYLFSRADADLVKIELDIGWALVAGVDPIGVLNRYAGRVISVHIKDYDPTRALGDDPARFPIPAQAQIVEPGSGPTDFAPIMAAVDTAGVEYRFVEIDVAPEPMAALTRGYSYLDSI